MSATDPIHQEIKYANGKYTRSTYKKMTKEEIKKALQSTPFPYSWGVYTTAYSRALLQRVIDLAVKQLGPENVLYCDTDSIKVRGDLDLTELNKEQEKRAIKTGAFADDKNGVRHYMGVFEQDAKYDKFITQGAKRYAYEKDGHIGVTVSGVTKLRNEETGEYFAVEELKNLERFKPGMIWVKAGGTMAVYNDKDNFHYTDPETGKTIHITKNVSIIPTTYKMTYEKDYELLLREIKLYGEYKSERE